MKPKNCDRNHCSKIETLGAFLRQRTGQLLPTAPKITQLAPWSKQSLGFLPPGAPEPIYMLPKICDGHIQPGRDPAWVRVPTVFLDFVFCHAFVSCYNIPVPVATPSPRDPETAWATPILIGSISPFYPGDHVASCKGPRPPLSEVPFISCTNMPKIVIVIIAIFLRNLTRVNK